jgi:hypothetical protein
MDRVDFGVIYNSETCRYHLNNFKDHDCKEWGMYSDPTYFLKFFHPKNVAVLHWPYPADERFGSIVDQVYDRCDQIFVIITELHRPAMEFMQTYDKEKITFYIAGAVGFDLLHATVKPFQDWFHTSSYFYKEYLPEIVSRFKYTETKPHAFEILLGRKKPHRDYVYNFVQEHLHKDDYILRYLNATDPKIYEDGERWTSEHRGVKDDGIVKNWTVETVEYYGHKMSLSQVIPIEIYNQTAYSVVAETNYDNFFTFFTEKTAKPIIAKRLFVMIAGQGYLRTLQNMGFKTFNGIIDESYDTIENNQERWQAACEQIKFLCNQDQAEILEKVKPIVEHNFNVMMSHNWYNEFNQDLESCVAQVLQQT